MQDKACVSEQIQITNTSTFDIGDTLTYHWVIEDTDFIYSSLSSPNYTWNNPGTYQVKLVIRNQYGDSSQIQKEISVKRNPDSDFEWDFACSGIPINFVGKNHPSELYGEVSFNWKMSNSVMLTGREVNQKYDSIGNKIILLRVESDHGCWDTTEKSLDVLRNEAVDFIANKTCFGDRVYFTNLSTDSTKKYRFSFGDGVDAFNVYHTSHLYAQSRTFNVTLSTDDGCKNQITKSVVLYPIPDASFTYEYQGMTVAVDGPSGYDDYKWVLQNGDTSDQEDPSFLTADVDGDSICLTTTKDGCISDEYCQVIQATSGVQGEKKASILIYPNPTEDIVYISLASKNTINRIKILNSTGQILLEKKAGRVTTTLNLSELPPNVYFLYVYTNESIGVKKIILSNP